jgi:hypothetical protein
MYNVPRLNIQNNFYGLVFGYKAKMGARGGAVVKALRNKPEGRGIESRWCQNF